jgi:hypothetical protein
MTGDMMKSDKKRANPARSWLGGTFWRPRAWRVRESTMIMRVKLVRMINSEGATARSVRPMMMTRLVLGLPAPPPRLIDIVPPELVPVPEVGCAGVAGVAGVEGATAVTWVWVGPLPVV